MLVEVETGVVTKAVVSFSFGDIRGCRHVIQESLIQGKEFPLFRRT